MRAWTRVNSIAAVVVLALLAALAPAERAGAQGVVEAPCGAARMITVDGPPVSVVRDPTGNGIRLVAQLRAGAVYSLGVADPVVAAAGYPRLSFRIIDERCQPVVYNRPDDFGTGEPTSQFWLQFFSPRPKFGVPSSGQYTFILDQGYPNRPALDAPPLLLSLVTEVAEAPPFPPIRERAPEISLSTGFIEDVVSYEYDVHFYRLFVAAGTSVRLDIAPEDLFDSQWLQWTCAPEGARIYGYGGGSPLFFGSGADASQLTQTIYSPVDAWYTLRIGSFSGADYNWSPRRFRFRLLPGPMRPDTPASYPQSAPLQLVPDAPASRVWVDGASTEVWFSADVEPGRVYYLESSISRGERFGQYLYAAPRLVFDPSVASSDTYSGNYFAVNTPRRLSFVAQFASSIGEFRLRSFVPRGIDLAQSTVADVAGLLPGAAPVSVPAVNWPFGRCYSLSIPPRSIGVIERTNSGGCESSIQLVWQVSSPVVGSGETAADPAVPSRYQWRLANPTDFAASVVIRMGGRSSISVPDPEPCDRTLALRIEPLSNLNTLARGPAQPTPIVLDTRYDGYITNGTWQTEPFAYQGLLSLSRGRLYEFTLASPVQYIGTQFEVRPVSGSVNDGLRGSTNSSPAGFRFVPTNSGDYIVSVGAISPSFYQVFTGSDGLPVFTPGYNAFGLFSLTARDVGEAVDDFPNVPEAAPLVSLVAGRTAGRIDFSGDVDYLRVRLPSAGRFRVTLGVPGGARAALGVLSPDPIVGRLFDRILALGSSEQPALLGTLAEREIILGVSASSSISGQVASSGYDYTISVDRLPIADIVGLGGVRGADGQITSDDLIAFLNAFFTLDVSLADVAQVGGVPLPDGWLTGDDVVAFIQAFIAGE